MTITIQAHISHCYAHHPVTLLDTMEFAECEFMELLRCVITAALTNNAQACCEEMGRTTEWVQYKGLAVTAPLHHTSTQLHYLA